VRLLPENGAIVFGLLHKYSTNTKKYCFF